MRNPIITKVLETGGKHQKALVFTALALLGVLTFGRFAGNYFTSEDFTYLYNSIIAPGYSSFFLNNPAGGVLNGRFLPLLMCFYRLGNQLFGLNPAGFHVCVLVVHILNSFLVYLISRELTGKKRLAFIIAAIHVTFSLHVTAVFWLSCANFVLAAFAYLLSFYLFIRYLKSLKGVYYFFFVVFFAVSILLHEIAYTLPLLCLLYPLIFPPGYKALKRLDNIMFLMMPPLAVYLVVFYVQMSAGSTLGLVGAKAMTLWRNPGLLLLKPFLGMSVMLAPEISSANWFFNIIRYAGVLVDNYPGIAQLLFLGIVSLGFLNRAARFGILFYLITSFMLHFATFGSLNNYYLASIGYLIFGVSVLAHLVGLLIRDKRVFRLLCALFLMLVVSVNILVVQGRGASWRAGGAIARSVLEKVKNKYPVLPSGAQIFLYDVPAVDYRAKVNIFRFRTINDAIKLSYQDPSVSAYIIKTNQIYLNPRTLAVNGGYLYLPYNQLLDLTDNPQIIRLFSNLKRPSFIFKHSFPTRNKFYFRYANGNLNEIKIKRPIDFSRLYEINL